MSGSLRQCSDIELGDRGQYRFGRTLGAGTYGIVREAESNGERFAIKIILKKNVRGNEKMVYDEMVLLQRMKHKHIVRFHDWFESKVGRPLVQISRFRLKLMMIAG